MCGQEGGKNPAVPGVWHGLVGAGNEMSLMPLRAGGWGGGGGSGSGGGRS